MKPIQTAAIPMPTPTAMSEKITWREVAALLSPAGQDQLIALINKAQDERGAEWLPYIQDQFPMASWIIELVCTKTADEAYREASKAFPTYPLWIAETPLKNLHGRLLTEIERKR